MRLTFLRGACTIIETKGIRILTDPWLEDGVYEGAWGHFPRFTDGEYETIGDIDYIYVSHIHPDHFDPKTMRRLKAMGVDAPVFIHSYPTKFLKAKIEETGFAVIECPHGKPQNLGQGVALSIYSADDCDPAMCGAFFGCAMPGIRNTQIDSMAVLTDGKHTIVNINDCPWGLSQQLCEKIAQDFPSIDLAMIAYAGAGPYPQCFAMPNEQKKREAKAKRADFLAGVINFAKTLRAKRVFPFAGDYQLCGKLSALNEVRGVPEVIEVYAALHRAGVQTLGLNPGQSADITSPGYWMADLGVPRRSYVDKVLKHRKLDYEDDDDPGLLNDDLQPAFQRFDNKRREYGLQAKATTYIDIGGNDIGFIIPPAGQPYYSYSRNIPEPYVRISTDPRMLKRLLQGPKHAHWNNAQIGSHIQFDRKPIGLYEPGLYHLLSFFHA